MAEPGWHSFALRVLYEALGWLSFTVWSLSFYPQVLLNYRRKSVTGLNFDFVVFNLTKHTSYLIFNASLFFSATVQQQYHEKYGQQQLIPVSGSDVAFSVHAVALTVITAYQILIYDRGGQRISTPCKLITASLWSLAAVLFLETLQSGAWLWLVTIFNYFQVLMTTIKYIPQAWFNMLRRSTMGWSISNVLLDFSGGLASFLMMFLQSWDQDTFSNFTGNVGKLALSLETVAFDLLFMAQHYLLYPQPGGHLPLRKEPPPSVQVPDEQEPLMSGNEGMPCVTQTHA